MREGTITLILKANPTEPTNVYGYNTGSAVTHYEQHFRKGVSRAELAAFLQQSIA